MALKWASLYGWIVPLWLAGAVLASIRLVWATRHVRAVRRTGVTAPAGIAMVEHWGSRAETIA